MQGSRQLIPVELWIMSRTRDGAHINQPFYIVRFEETDELRHRTRGVADRHNN